MVDTTGNGCTVQALSVGEIGYIKLFMISLTKTEEFPELTGIKAIATQVKLEMDQSLYYDILGQRDSIMTSGSPMSLWGSMTQLYKPPTTCQQQVS